MQRYPQSRLMLLDASCMRLVAGLTAAFVVALTVEILCFALFNTSFSIGGMRVSFLALGASLLALLFRLGLALAHKCPACGKHPTIQGFGELHPSVADDGDNAWVRVVRDVLRSRTFRCFHCGACYNVENSA